MDREPNCRLLSLRFRITDNEVNAANHVANRADQEEVLNMAIVDRMLDEDMRRRELNRSRKLRDMTQKATPKVFPATLDGGHIWTLSNLLFLSRCPYLSISSRSRRSAGLAAEENRTRSTAATRTVSASRAMINCVV